MYNALMYNIYQPFCGVHERESKRERKRNTEWERVSKRVEKREIVRERITTDYYNILCIRRIGFEQAGR